MIDINPINIVFGTLNNTTIYTPHALFMSMSTYVQTHTHPHSEIMIL